MEILSSGADHEAVARANPHWSEFDWCWYWHRDLLRALKKADIPGTPDVITDCDDPRCICREKLK